MSNYNDFEKILKDLLKDLLITYPELENELNDDLRDILIEDDENKTALKNVYEFCKNVFPEKFFDILYENVEMFQGEDDTPLYLLPDIDFKKLWNNDISENTKKTLWKYLQLLLFSVINDVENGKSFGDAAKLFEAIDENEFKSKIEETIEQMQNVFNNNDISLSDVSNVENINLNDLPDPDKLHEHISSMFDGKLGKLAKEIAEETANELNADDEYENVDDVFQKLFKNPGKLMSLVKNISKKLDDKMKRGDIDQEELMKEAKDIMERMNGMDGLPGMDKIKSMFGKMGVNQKQMEKGMNMMKHKLNENIKHEKIRERMKKKLENRRNQKVIEKVIDPKAEALALKNMEELIFSTGEMVEKSKKKKKKKKKKKTNTGNNDENNIQVK